MHQSRPLTQKYYIVLAVSVLFFCTTLMFPPPIGMPQSAWHVAGIAVLMATWWIFEIVPIPVTALLPIAIGPLLKIMPINAITTPYAHPIIFLFIGGFMLGKALERWQLHKRVSLWTILQMGNHPRHQIAGFMLITAFFSMWISNTATTIMMAPLAMSVIKLLEEHDEPNHESYAKALLLCIAYSASIGGIGTIIGTPPNAFLMAFLQENYNIHIGFAHWMLIAIPVVIIMLILCWVWLTHFKFNLPHELKSEIQQLFQHELELAGPITKGEKLVAVVFCLTALAWITRPIMNSLFHIPIGDTGIAIISTITMFFIPVDRHKGVMLMDWDTAKTIPWGILLLFGGGLSLANMMQTSGLANWIAAQLTGMTSLPTLALMGIVVTVIIFLTEITSNLATVATFLPPLGALAISAGIDPALLCIPATIAASCAFMMPVATAPNAIVFSYKRIQITDMIMAGFVLNLLGIVAITAITVIGENASLFKV